MRFIHLLNFAFLLICVCSFFTSSCSSCMEDHICTGVNDQADEVLEMLEEAKTNKKMRKVIVNNEGPLLFSSRYETVDGMFDDFIAKCERYSDKSDCAKARPKLIRAKEVLAELKNMKQGSEDVSSTAQESEEFVDEHDVVSINAETESVKDDDDDPKGFFSGLWHGFLVVFRGIGSLIWEIDVYADVNTGTSYLIGFIIGVILFFGGTGSGASSQR